MEGGFRLEKPMRMPLSPDRLNTNPPFACSHTTQSHYGQDSKIEEDDYEVVHQSFSLRDPRIPKRKSGLQACLVGTGTQTFCLRHGRMFDLSSQLGNETFFFENESCFKHKVLTITLVNTRVRTYEKKG